MPRKARETPWIDKRGDRFYAFWYDPKARETKRLSLRTSDRDEAQTRFAGFLVEGQSIFEPRGDDGITTSRALDDYFEEWVVPNCADWKRQRDCIVHLKAFFGDFDLSSIDIPKSRSYANARRRGVIGGGARQVNRAGSDSTIRRELGVLVAASNHAKKWKRIKELPSVEKPAETRLGVDEEAPYYTKDEIDLLKYTASGELRWFIDLAYWTGARRRSIEKLTRGQVQMGQKRILLMLPGKKATKKRQPIVPVLDEMRPALDELLARPGDRLFRTPDFYRPFRELCEMVGLEDRARPHILRHSRATHLLQKGVSIYTVARLLGDTVATVERVYGHHATDYIADEIGGL